MRERKCPACGASIQETTAKCPACGLEGLDLLFLSQADYEKWEKEVLNPHIAARLPKVFAGFFYGLILTPQGKLYGIGKNYAHVIDEDPSSEWLSSYPHPHLLAEDVISAAAQFSNSIHVTRDGKVHMRGRRELKKRFSGFSGAKAVYADFCMDFWIVDKNNQVWFLENGSDEKAICKPVLYPECEWRLHTPWKGTEPLSHLEKEFLAIKQVIPNARKIVRASSTTDLDWLVLEENGTVSYLKDGSFYYDEEADEEYYEVYRGKLDWLKQPVIDIASHGFMYMLVCRNGDILWCHFPEYLINGEMEVIHLTELT